MSKRALPWMAAAAATLSIASVQAQALTDPMRPPQGIAPAEGAGEAAGTQLQSVLISPGRRLAIINGTTVPLGGMVGDSKVVKITETEVVLQRGEETEVLKLFPAVEKQRAKRPVREGRSK